MTLFDSECRNRRENECSRSGAAFRDDGLIELRSSSLRLLAIRARTRRECQSKVQRCRGHSPFTFVFTSRAVRHPPLRERGVVVGRRLLAAVASGPGVARPDRRNASLASPGRSLDARSVASRSCEAPLNDFTPGPGRDRVELEISSFRFSSVQSRQIITMAADQVVYLEKFVDCTCGDLCSSNGPAGAILVLALTSHNASPLRPLQPPSPCRASSRAC